MFCSRVTWRLSGFCFCSLGMGNTSPKSRNASCRLTNAIRKTRNASCQPTNAIRKIRNASRQLTNAIRKIRNASCRLTNALRKIRNASCQSTNALRKIWNASCQSTNALRKIRSAFCLLTKAIRKIRSAFYRSRESPQKNWGCEIRQLWACGWTRTVAADFICHANLSGDGAKLLLLRLFRKLGHGGCKPPPRGQSVRACYWLSNAPMDSASAWRDFCRSRSAGTRASRICWRWLECFHRLKCWM